MPGDICLQIARQAKKDAWKIDDLLQIIKFEIEAREMSEATKSSEKPGLLMTSPKHDGTKSPLSPTAKSLLIESRDPNTTRVRINCAYCNGLHYSASCEKVKDPETRRQILGQSGRCFICLRKGHQAKSCTSTKGCRHCQRKHHQSICLQPQRDPPQESHVPPHPPPPHPMHHPLHPNRPLDLKPVKREVLHLNTFGENRFKRQNCSVQAESQKQSYWGWCRNSSSQFSSHLLTTTIGGQHELCTFRWFGSR